MKIELRGGPFDGAQAEVLEDSKALLIPVDFARRVGGVQAAVAEAENRTDWPWPGRKKAEYNPTAEVIDGRRVFEFTKDWLLERAKRMEANQ